jgi:hypothetical protein
MSIGSARPRGETSQKRTLLLVDGDNIDSRFRVQKINVWFDHVVNWIPTLATGLGPIGRTCIFICENGMANYGLQLLDESRFCIHRYDRAPGEPGPADTEIVQEAWRRRDEYDHFIFMSYDTDFARFAVEIRQGIWDDDDQPDTALSREVTLITEPPPGISWRYKLGLRPDTCWDAYAWPWLSIDQLLSQIRYLSR